MKTGRALCLAAAAWAVLAPLHAAEVRNRDKPAMGDWDLKPVRIWRIDRAGEEIFGLPFSLRVGEEGRLFVYDTENNINYIFDPDGNYRKNFAAGGQGPGEIIGQGRTFLVGDKVIISGANGFHYFTKEGDCLRTVRQEGSRLPPQLFLNEDELIAAPLTGYHTPEGEGRILLQNLRLGTEKVLAEFPAFRGGVGWSNERLFDMVVVGLSPLLTIGRGGDRIYWGMSDEYLIHVIDLEGRGIGTFSIDRKPVRISGRTKRTYFRRQNLPPDALDQIIDSFPDALTSFHRIEIHGGLVYVFVPELDLEASRGKIRQIDIFSPEGNYLYRAEIELGKGLTQLFSPLDNLIIQGNFMYSVCETADDTVVIVKFRVALPAN
jgi:hypothetical protein